MQKNFIRYVTEAKFGETITITISVNEAIQRQFEYGAKMGYKYNSEEEALEDFMANNWAWFYEETPY